jgi:carotenoid cleavage dioxygenase-like enzyme
MHDFSLTNTHVVVYDLPATFDFEAINSGLINVNDSFPYRWNPDYQARIGVLPCDGDAADVRWFDVEPLLRVPHNERVRRRRKRRGRRRAPSKDVRLRQTRTE